MADGRGRLLVVGTPIGNLGDLTPRAADALRTADLVVAEDTRLAARLLAHLDVRRPMLSFTEHNAASRMPELLVRLAAGETLALTTDAGMPAVSDPGAALVAAARDAGAPVEVVPGPSAVTAAMALAGVEASGFVFGGFMPARPASARAARLRELLGAAGGLGLPLVLFEAPHRMRWLLEALAAESPAARVALAREITKRHEETVVGTAAELTGTLGEPRGEFTVVVSALPVAEAARADASPLLETARRLGLSERATIDILRAAGVPRRDAYRLVQTTRHPAEEPDDA